MATFLLSCVRFCIPLLLLAPIGCAQAPSRAPPTVRFVDTGVGESPALVSKRPTVDFKIDEELVEPDEPTVQRFQFIEPKADPANAPPIYPARLKAKRLPPTIVSVRLSVETDGAVFGVEPIEPATSADQRALIEAVRDACWSWKYSPLIRLELNRGETFTIDKNGASSRYEGHPTPLPFHIDYAFRFSRQDDDAFVEMRQIGTASESPGQS